MTVQSTKDSEDSAYIKRSLFGRRQGRALKGERLEAYSRILPQIEIKTETLKPSTNPADFFGKPFERYWLEIGFGHGERLAQEMQQKPKTGFLAAEPFKNGIADFTNIIQSHELSNIRAIEDDGMILARSLAFQSLDGIYILNPDPWHKARHHKRRIINQENLDILAHILKPGASLVLTTDVEDLANWMCMQTSNHSAFEWQAQTKSDWEKPPENWISTRYEKKGAKGAKKMTYMIFKKN